MHRATSTLIPAVALLALPSTADAATVSMRTERIDVLTTQHVVFEAAPGERNLVEARVTRSDDGGSDLVVEDTGTVVIASEPCRSLDVHTVICAAEDGQFLKARFLLADLDDRFRITNDDPGLTGPFSVEGGPGADRLAGEGLFYGETGDDRISGRSTLDGGPGDDRLIGGPSGDALDGGGGRDALFGRGGNDTLTDGDHRDAGIAPGPDLLDGGSDEVGATLPSDTVSYRGRTEPVDVDLGHAGTDGEPGERDVLVGIESVEGGSGDDRLAGDLRVNRLVGGGGHDRLIGRGGDDFISSGPGGGRSSCGSGRDVVGPTTARDLLDADCERLDVLQAGIDEDIDAQPRWTGGALSLGAQCPLGAEALARCSGTFHLRERTTGRLLASGWFPEGRWWVRRVPLRLTAIGRRLAARRHGVRVIVRLGVRSREGGEVLRTAVRWSIVLTLGRRRAGG